MLSKWSQEALLLCSCWVPRIALVPTGPSGSGPNYLWVEMKTGSLTLSSGCCSVRGRGVVTCFCSLAAACAKLTPCKLRVRQEEDNFLQPILFARRVWGLCSDTLWSVSVAICRIEQWETRRDPWILLLLYCVLHSLISSVCSVGVSMAFA